jgi:hypothetical protein
MSEDLLPALNDQKVPEAFRSYFEGEGSTPEAEMVEVRDVRIPRLKLLQPLSPEVQEQGAKAGQIIDSIEGTPRDLPLPIVPCGYWKSRLRWRKRSEGRGIICRAEFGRLGEGYPGIECPKCGLWRWGEDSTQPECTETHNFGVLLLKDKDESGRWMMERTVLSFDRTKYSVGTGFLNGLLKISTGGRRWFTTAWLLGSRLDKNERGETYWNLELKAWKDGHKARSVTDEAVLQEGLDFTTFCLDRIKRGTALIDDGHQDPDASFEPKDFEEPPPKKAPPAPPARPASPPPAAKAAPVKAEPKPAPKAAPEPAKAPGKAATAKPAKPPAPVPDELGGPADEGSKDLDGVADNGVEDMAL